MTEDEEPPLISLKTARAPQATINQRLTKINSAVTPFADCSWPTTVTTSVAFYRPNQPWLTACILDCAASHRPDAALISSHLLHSSGSESKGEKTTFSLLLFLSYQKKKVKCCTDLEDKVRLRGRNDRVLQVQGRCLQHTIEDPQCRSPRSSGSPSPT